MKFGVDDLREAAGPFETRECLEGRLEKRYGDEIGLPINLVGKIKDEN